MSNCLFREAGLPIVRAASRLALGATARRAAAALTRPDRWARCWSCGRLQRHVGAVVVGDPLFDSRSKEVAALAARHGVPTIYIQRKYVADGGLISYGAIFTAAYHLVGIYAGRI